MNSYNFNFEISKNLKMFESAFDDVVIKRYDDMTGQAKDSIKVNYIYGPKQRILQDLKGQPDTIKFPIIAVTTTGMGRDTERLKNKLQDIVYENEETKEFINLRAIPWNIEVQMTIMCKFQEDLNQIAQNFAVYTNPYIVYSWREPKSGREVRTEVYWDGKLNVDYPGGQNDLPANMPFRVMATANFTIKTWLYRTVVKPIKPICYIYNDIIVTENFYCDYETLVSHTTGSNMTDHYVLSGQPQIKWINPYYISEGQSPIIKIQGDGYLHTFALFVSGSPGVYPNQTTFYPKSASGDMTPYEGVLIDNFNILNPRELTFKLPPPSGFGFVDVIAVNPCGMGQLTKDANRCNRVLNPYPVSDPAHYNWCVEQYPYLNGLIIANVINDGYVIDYTKQIISTYGEYII